MIIMCAPTVRARSSAWLRLAAHRLLELAEHAPAQQPRRHVDLHVELAELGLEVRVGDRLERAGVDHRRVALLVGQVELDLEADRARSGSKRDSRSMRANTSRQVRTFWR